MNKATGNILGIILLVMGIIIGIIGLFSFISAPKAMDSSNPAGSFSSILFNAGLGIIALFIGTILIIVAVVILYFANVGKAYSFLAKETAPGVERTSKAVGRGLYNGFKRR
jgi:Ca2+/Na+ antiporter